MIESMAARAGVAVVGSAIGAAMIAFFGRGKKLLTDRFGLNTKNRQLQLLQNFNLLPHHTKSAARSSVLAPTMRHGDRTNPLS